MSPETERNVNNFVNSWNYTGAVLGLLFCIAIGVPALLFLLVAFVLPCLQLLFSPFEFGLKALPVSLTIAALLYLLYFAIRYDGISVFDVLRKKTGGGFLRAPVGGGEPQTGGAPLETLAAR